MSETHSAPSAPIIERAILAAALTRSEFLDEFGDSDGIFALPEHKALFAALHRLRPRQGKFDVQMLLHRLSQSEELSACGGAELLLSLHGEARLNRVADDLLELRSFHGRREAYEVGRWVTTAAATPDGNFMEALIEGQGIVAAAIEGARKVPSSRELVHDSFQRFKSRFEGKTSSMGISTIPEIDRYLYGMHPGRVWVLGAYPSGGKSVLASQLVTDAALEDVPAAYLTLEMDVEAQADRMVVQACGINADFFRDPRSSGISPVEIERMKARAKVFQDKPWRVVKPRKRTLGAILAEIRLAHREMGAKVVAVDYLQLIQAGLKGNRTREDEASEISHALQAIAQDLGLTLLLLTQLNADGDTKHGRVIEEDADVFLKIDQDRNKESETFKQHTGITLVKDRHCGNGGTRLPLFFNRERLRFVPGQFPAKKEPERKRFQR